MRTIHITWFYVVSNSYFFNLFNNHEMYILQMISKISYLISQMFYHAVLLKSHCQNHIQANGTGTATILCNFNTPSLLLVFSVHHISLYMQWNTCSCLRTSSTYGTPHSVQLSCFIYPVPLLPVTIFTMIPHMWKTPIILSCPSLSVHTYQCGSHQTDLHEIWYWRLFIESVETTQIWLQLPLSTVHKDVGTFYCWQWH